MCCFLEEAQKVLLLNQDPGRKKNDPLHTDMACDTKAVVLIPQGEAPPTGTPTGRLNYCAASRATTKTGQPREGCWEPFSGQDRWLCCFSCGMNLLEKSEDGYMPTSFSLPDFKEETNLPYATLKITLNLKVNQQVFTELWLHTRSTRDRKRPKAACHLI